MCEQPQFCSVSRRDYDHHEYQLAWEKDLALLTRCGPHARSSLLNCEQILPHGTHSQYAPPCPTVQDAELGLVGPRVNCRRSTALAPFPTRQRELTFFSRVDELRHGIADNPFLNNDLLQCASSRHGSSGVIKDL